MRLFLLLYVGFFNLEAELEHPEKMLEEMAYNVWVQHDASILWQTFNTWADSFISVIIVFQFITMFWAHCAKLIQASKLIFWIKWA